MAAHDRFRVIDGKRTAVQYVVDADLGGALPDWLKQMIARDQAHNTLRDLRQRVRWTQRRGPYGLRAGQLKSEALLAGFGGQASHAGNPPAPAPAGVP